MLLTIVLVHAAIWATAPGHASEFTASGNNTKRRITATFSIADPEGASPSLGSPSLGTRFGETPTRPSNKYETEIIFRNGDRIVTLSPGRIDKTITQGVLQLTLQLDHAIAFEGKALSHDQNTIFSPASISMALALVLLGAQGETLREVSRVLGIATPDDLKDRSDLVHEQFGALLARFDSNPSANQRTQTSIANGIFIQKEYAIKERFIRLSRSLYRSDIIRVDFERRGDQAKQTINRWVSDKTFGRIKEFLSEAPDTETKVLLASAIYFNGEWETPFPVTNTRTRSFYVSGSRNDPTGSEVLEVTMMAHAFEIPYSSDSDLDCQIVGLPYKGNKVVMWVVLPNARGFEGLNRLKDRLTVPVLDSLVSSTSVEQVIVSMPRMKLEATLNLRTTLEALGLRSLFDPASADLGGISPGIERSRPTYRPNVNQDNEEKFIFASRFGGADEPLDNTARKGEESYYAGRKGAVSGVKDRRRVSRQTTGSNPGLYVDDVIHKVEIEVTETGTVASAVTALSISRDGSTRNVRLDRPFLFFIRDETSKLVLFWGAIVRPT